jgi:gliding motility-associated-like protein
MNKPLLPLIAILLMICGPWSARAQQGADPCASFSAQIVAESGSFNLCPETAGTEYFLAEATYLQEGISHNPQNFVYSWLIDGTAYTGIRAGHAFSSPGAYPVTLTVTDPDNDCRVTVRELVRVGTVPSFSGTIATVEEACAEAPFSLVGSAQPTMWTGFQTAVSETHRIPDGTGDRIESSLVFDVFANEKQITSAIDIDKVCVILEHTDFGQVFIELECPGGNTITLKDFGMGGANLGEPVVWDDHLPGRGYEYCFSPEPQFGRMDETAFRFHAYTDVAGNYYYNAPYLPQGTYTPDESLVGLTGCPFNGEWTLRVRDNVAGESGHFLGWSLYFGRDHYPDSLIFTPEIVEGTWYGDQGALDGNPAVVTIAQEGEYPFRFEATDDFGCTYDTTIFVRVLPQPRAEIISQLEIPVCEGDSTLLTLVPSGDNDLHWAYQWRMAGQDIPDQTMDTLTVKEPGLYSVMVTDTVTGCFREVSVEFSVQNCDLVIPNVFTPNGDGINDVFEILNLEHYPLTQVVIYNRWGNKVFEHSDYYNNWWEGHNHPDGVYFYVLKYTRLGETKYAEGAVTIIR